MQTIGDPCVDFANESRASERLVLRQMAGVSIVRAEGQDVSNDNFYPALPGQFDLKLADMADPLGDLREMAAGH